MLRAAVVAASSLAACAGMALIVAGAHPLGWWLLLVGVIVLVGTVFERWRYRRLCEHPGGAWRATGERFLDPSTGDPVDVFFDPRTGERRYVAEKPSQERRRS